MVDQRMIMRWIRALRSGKYKQGRKYLKQEIDGEVYHCCLGVACEVAELLSERDITGVYFFKMHGKRGFPPYINQGFLPEVVKEAYGVSDEVEATLIGMNDPEEDGKSFDEIADYLEETYL